MRVLGHPGGSSSLLQAHLAQCDFKESVAPCADEKIESEGGCGCSDTLFMAPDAGSDDRGYQLAFDAT